tara:strand:+ start:35333 stop:36256 length:924 start_codon:yes stop_codon:yes gene_type:complete
VSYGETGTEPELPFEFASDSLATDAFSFRAAYALGHASFLVYDDDTERVTREIGGQGAGLADLGSQMNPFSLNATQGMVLETEERFVLVIRGSKGKEDWKLNLQAKQRHIWFDVPGRIHTGFWRALNQIWDAVIIPLMALSKSSGKKIVISGHSLGGAIATLVAARIATKFDRESIVSIYTFGQPRVGNAKFAKSMNEQFEGAFFRFVNHRDIVTMIPPAPLYRHVGKLIQFDPAGAVLEDQVTETRRKFGPSLSPEEFKQFAEHVRKHGLYETVQERRDFKSNVANVEDHSINRGYLPKLKLNLES